MNHPPTPPPSLARNSWRWRLARRVPLVLLAEPFECFFALLSVLSGLATFLVSRSANNMTTLGRVLGAGQYVWAGVLIIGGTLILAGLLHAMRRPDAALALALERIGLTILAFTGGMWAVALTTAGLRAVPVACVVAAYAGSCALRAFVLGTLRALGSAGASPLRSALLAATPPTPSPSTLHE